MSTKIQYEHIEEIHWNINVYKFADIPEKGKIFDKTIMADSEMARFSVRPEHFESPNLVFIYLTFKHTWIYFSQDDYFYKHDVKHWSNSDWKQYAELRADGVLPLEAIGFVEL